MQPRTPAPVRRTARHLRTAALVGVVGAALALPGRAQNDGLRADPAAASGRMQLRLGMTGLTYGLLSRSPADAGAAALAGPSIRSATLLGDYYLGQMGGTGGLRATGGLLLGERLAPWSGVPRLGQPLSLDVQALRLGAGESPPSAAAAGPRRVPYMGLGYTSAPWSAGWGFSADVGLMAMAPGRIGAALALQRGIDEVLRDLRLTPTVQFGASYAF